MEQAPFLAEVTRAPENVTCAWLRADDGVRLRVAGWRAGCKGTVLLFPGRTEYIEKYGPAAGEFTARGYSVLTIDWRGQGLADRLIPDARRGHVRRFSDYQRDVDAAIAFAREIDLPQPWFLVGHSMGGCIGLRALHRGIPVRAVTFSAPMWGIKMHPLMRPVAWSLSFAATISGQGWRMTPSTTPENYVLTNPFEDNVLTRDPEMYEFMRRQLVAHPELGIGGPTLQWLYEALKETRALMRMDAPDIPCLTVLGAEERIVHAAAIHDRMRRWPGAEFDLVGNAEHELMMETPPIRQRFFDRAAGLFDRHATTETPAAERVCN